jgi:hypothetical protein
MVRILFNQAFFKFFGGNGSYYIQISYVVYLLSDLCLMRFKKLFLVRANSLLDILWVRDEESTRKLYGAKYRPGRVSGTQKNADRRSAALIRASE